MRRALTAAPTPAAAPEPLNTDPGVTMSLLNFLRAPLAAALVVIATLATTAPELVWSSFGSWIRTIRPGVAPSEAVVAVALRNTLHHFLADNSPAPNLAKFIQQRMDLSRANNKRRPAA